MQNDPALDQLCINTIRTLSMDAVQKANSGHPGTPMALAPVAYHLWQNHLVYDPDEPLWPNRDRFARQQDAGPPGVPDDHRRRNHHRSARTGTRQ